MAKKPSTILKRLKKALKVPKTKFQKDEYLEGQARKMSRNKTEPERLFEQLLNEIEIQFEDQKIIGGKIYDYFIPDKNTLIEIDGDYWHAKDLTLEEMNSVQVKTTRNDRIKDSIAKSGGYDLVRIWEEDLNDRYEETKQKIKYILS